MRVSKFDRRICRFLLDGTHQIFYRDRASLEVGVRVAGDIRASAPEGAPLSLAFAAELLGGVPLTESLRVGGASAGQGARR